MCSIPSFPSFSPAEKYFSYSVLPNQYFVYLCTANAAIAQLVEQRIRNA